MLKTASKLPEARREAWKRFSFIALRSTVISDF